MTRHLPADELLIDYASGAVSPGVALLLSSHMARVPDSASRVRDLEEIGGALLTNADDIAMSDGALDSVMAMLDEAPAAQSPSIVANDDCPLPRPVMESLGVAFDQIPWKFKLPGVSAHDIEGFDGEKVSLLRAKPGSAVPQHTHEGVEMTLVLQGVLLDGEHEYHPGDIAVNDEEDDHRPRIGGDEMCYCLIVQHGDLKFTGRFSRILNLFGE